MVTVRTCFVLLLMRCLYDPRSTLRQGRAVKTPPLRGAAELNRYDNGTDWFERIFFGALPCPLQPIKRLSVVVENFLQCRL